MKRRLPTIALLLLLYLLTLCVAASAQNAHTQSHNRRVNELLRSAARNDSPEVQAEIVAEVISVLETKGQLDQMSVEKAAEVIGVVARRDPKLAARAVPSLNALLPTCDGRDACEVIRALGEIGPDAALAIDNLKLVLREEDSQFKDFEKVHALGALARIVPGDSRGPYVQELIERLRSEHQSTRWLAAEALGRLTPTEVIRTALAEAMKDRHVTVRSTAAETWCRLGYPADPLLIDTLVEALRNDGGGYYLKPTYLSEWTFTNHLPALRAVQYLAKNQGELPAELHAPLRECLRNDDAVIKKVAVRTIKIAGLDDPITIAALKETMQRETEHSEVYDEVKELLAELESSGSRSSQQ